MGGLRYPVRAGTPFWTVGQFGIGAKSFICGTRTEFAMALSIWTFQGQLRW
jgi:hypothetical protein